MAGTSHEVQNELARAHRRRRSPGEGVYPVEYSRALADMCVCFVRVVVLAHCTYSDGWTHLLTRQLYRGPTLLPVPRIPTRVLDLGCGPGHWVIETATQWTVRTCIYARVRRNSHASAQETTFVGLDMQDIQPKFEILADVTAEYADMARRIKWVHQNLCVRACASRSTFSET
jgi:SAM-dependent methyltransferase